MTATWQNDLHRRSSQFAAVGVLLFLVALFGSIGAGLTTQRLLLHGYPIVYRPPYVSALDPIKAAEAGIAPAAASTNPVPNPSVKTINVSDSTATLVVGGIRVKTVHLHGDGLAELSSAIDESSWIAETSPDVYSLKAALIFLGGTDETFAAPTVKTIDLADMPGVFLGFQSAKATFRSVTVTAPEGTSSPPSSPHFRPFVEASDGTRLFIDSSTFTNLGWDWNASYGVSFMDGSTGSVTNSKFMRNFIGIYTDHAKDIDFSGNTLSYNDLYGLDPHSFSADLSISGNVADHNAAHGIIFSNHVTTSVIRSNITSYNGENGIMMDESSMRNTLEDNTSDHNTGDGVVLSSSSDNTITDNTLQFNRVGINVYGAVDKDPTVTGNTISNNVAASAGFTLDASTNDALHNVTSLSVPPPSWHVVFIYFFWPATAVFFLVAIGIRIGERRRLPPRVPPE